MLDREVSKLEDRELEVMETVEGQRAQLSRWDEEPAGEEGELQTIVANTPRPAARLIEEIAALEAQRAVISREQTRCC